MKGRVRRLSDTELEALAKISPADIAALEARVLRHGDALFNAMLDATPLDEPTAGESKPLDGLSIPCTGG